MHIFGPSWAAKTTLILVIACVYAGAVQLNNKLFFPWAEFDEFRYLIYIPAGIKLLLMMLFGWRAVIGISLGIATVVLGEFANMSYLSACTFGVVSGVVPYLGLIALSKISKISYPWNGLNFKTITIISIGIGSIEAVTLHLLLTFNGVEPLSHLIEDTLPSVFGRVLGTYLFMGLAVWVRNEIAKDNARHNASL
ncbi:MAG: hypothetical protein ACOYB1_10490 [Limnohabitans sp.]